MNIALQAEARRWLGVPYAHQGRARAPGPGAVLDCLGLLMALAEALDLQGANGPLAALDRRDYAHRPDGALLKAQLDAVLRPAERPRAGQVALFRLQGQPQHLALLTELPDGRLGMIHAYAPLGRVVEHAFDGPWPRRLIATYEL